MDIKWRSKAKSPQQKTASFPESSLLPPSLRQLNRLPQHEQQQPGTSRYENKRKNRAATGFLKRFSAAILEPQSCSSDSSVSSAEGLPGEGIGRKAKGRAKSPIGNRSAEQSMGDLLNANMDLLEVRLSCANQNGNWQTRSSDGSADEPEPRRAARRGKMKARVEARRVEQLRGDSSLDESALELEHCQRRRRRRQQQQLCVVEQTANKRSRASRTERYLKRMCNGRYGLAEAAVAGSQQCSRIDDFDQLADAARLQRDIQCLQHDITSDNFYTRHTQVGVNPLVQQTLQYFSEFDRGSLAAQPVCDTEPRPPPPPPFRDHSSQLLRDKYQRIVRSPEPLPRFDQQRSQFAAVSQPAIPSSRGRLSLDTGTPAKFSEPSPQRRSSKNLEEALCELEAIYNSLQLGDEELLDRAERRTMEEFLYKGFTPSPDACDGAVIDPTCRRKTWADPSLDEPPDRLKDDMAYRRMHPRERPTSADGQSLSAISYLMTSPIPCRRDKSYLADASPILNPSRARRKEPDVTLDDVVFRNMHYVNNTLKVMEPQPPFGIPLGPITAAADSDYLHANPADSERVRSPYVGTSRQPDLVTDDLAFRNLRKDAQLSSRQSSPCFLPSTPSRSPLPLPRPRPAAHDGRVTNLYGSISNPTSPTEPDHEHADYEDLPLNVRTGSTLVDYCRAAPRLQQCLARRISDPEPMPANWQRSSWRDLESANTALGYGQHGNQQQQHCRRRHQKARYSDADPSDRSSCEESSDESIRPVSSSRWPLADDSRDSKPARQSARGRTSSSLSSISGIPSQSPPPPAMTRSLEPFTDHEISVYKQLCRDLENLVQLTQANDSMPQPSPGDLAVEQSVEPALPDVGPVAKAGLDIGEAATATDGSSINREISSILDNLKSLRENSLPEAGTGCSTPQCEREQTSPRAPASDEQNKGRLLEASKGGQERVEEEQTRGNEDEESEGKDQVDEKLFLRNVHLAKLSGDWKESTPSSDVANRRTSLVSDDNGRHWEGMKKCNHKYNSMPAKTSSLLMFRQYGSKRKSKNRKSICTIS